MRLIVLTLILLSSLLAQGKALASGLIEYHMRLPHAEQGTKRVALTFDACTGKVDERILNALIENKIKATIFVTARWLKRNPQAIATLKAHSDLIEVENHGAQHLPAIDTAQNVFGLKPAGSADAVTAEVEDGAAAVKASFGHWPKWFRGAAAEYTASSMTLIKSLGYRIGGFSASGDGGATWSESHAAAAVSAAQDGDVLITHINQPTKPAGAGVVKGILKLKEEGFIFVTLNEGFGDMAEKSPAKAGPSP